jgi:hypothetical protein
VGPAAAAPAGGDSGEVAPGAEDRPITEYGPAAGGYSTASAGPLLACVLAGAVPDQGGGGEETFRELK